MEYNEKIEFITMLLIENRCNRDQEFLNYIIVNSDKETFNKRYMILLDKFLKDYALSKAEKSD